MIKCARNAPVKQSQQRMPIENTRFLRWTKRRYKLCSGLGSLSVFPDVPLDVNFRSRTTEKKLLVMITKHVRSPTEAQEWDPNYNILSVQKARCQELQGNPLQRTVTGLHNCTGVYDAVPNASALFSCNFNSTRELTFFGRFFDVLLELLVLGLSVHHVPSVSLATPTMNSACLRGKSHTKAGQALGY